MTEQHAKRVRTGLFSAMVFLAMQFSVTTVATAATPTQNASATGSTETAVTWGNDMPRFELVHGLGTAALLGGFVAMEAGLFLRSPESARWNSSLVLDNAVRQTLGGRTVGAEEFAAGLSDIGMVSLMAAPFVDAAGAGFMHEDPDLAAQMALVGAEALVLSAFLTTIMKRSFGRERPLLSECHNSRLSDPSAPCTKFNSRRTESFPSGHTSMAFAGAGAVCAAHQSLPLWGEGTGNMMPCYVALGSATATGLLRIAGNRHHLSDVLVGAVVGLASGWLVPWALHYRGSNSSEATRTSALEEQPERTPDHLGGAPEPSAPQMGFSLSF